MLFGFVRFIRVPDVTEMVQKLNGIRINDRCIIANTAKYDRQGGKLVKGNPKEFFGAAHSYNGDVRDKWSIQFIGIPHSVKTIEALSN
ncbi:hypothetical protein OSB04_020155 [Centaurea solstitialis]|uniref:RRM domain-containing protein n=1 Tax=Centaurea solstitialis TaxID=347529 RepID=A0AA38W3L2_9ASTR|nr:hypothetical protein OSB04_020155 [Centaurea solstitialis]